jgi:hypothetical protein
MSINGKPYLGDCFSTHLLLSVMFVSIQEVTCSHSSIASLFFAPHANGSHVALCLENYRRSGTQNVSTTPLVHMYLMAKTGVNPYFYGCTTGNFIAGCTPVILRILF